MFLPFIRQYKKDISIALILLVVSLLPRILGLGLFLTADEKNWMGRSFEFIRAFHDLRFNDMLQTTHPGVTTLWVSGLAITAKSIISHVPFTNNNLIYFVKTSQFSIALLNALTIPALYVLLLLVTRNRFLSIVSVLLISFDPFLVGYSRVVHVDALMGSLLTIAVLCSILYARYLTRPWLVASAAFSVLAILTKIPAIFIGPFILVALIAYHPRALLSAHFLKDRARDAAMWILLGVVTTLLVWPALLWVPNPAGNVLQLNRDISEAAVTPHDSNEDYNLDATHYPYALLDRSTPVTLIGGFLGCGVVLWLAYKRRIPREMGLIAVYLFGFVFMMTLGAKKGDRYIIPAFFALDIMAAYGLVYVAQAVFKRWSRIAYGAISAVLLYGVFIIVSYHPYAIAYNNPFFPDNLSQELGWGEGLDQVAAWLNTNHPNAVVASWYPEELGTFTSATVLHINAHTQNPVNYIVLYQNMFGRAPEHYANDFIDEYYKKRNPVFVVKVAGKEYAWVYEKPSYSKSIGDLDNLTIVSQEVRIDHENFAGVQILPATHFGKSDTGTVHVEFAKSVSGPAIYGASVLVTDLKDSDWYKVLLPESVHVEKGEHLFVRMFATGTTAPYPSIRYSQENTRNTPIYVSRTGVKEDAKEKPGSLGVMLLYVGTDGKLDTELEEKLLK